MSMASKSRDLPRVTFQAPEKPGEESSHKKLGKLTVKYNRKDLQRRLDLEEWIDVQLQELYQYQLQEEADAATPEPEIDIEDLLEVSNEEQKSKLQEILHECSRPTEGVLRIYFLVLESKETSEAIMISEGIDQDFIMELLSRLQGLRKILQRK